MSNINFSTYSISELYNILSVTTKALKILVADKVRNQRFWQLVGAREEIIKELTKQNRSKTNEQTS